MLFDKVVAAVEQAGDAAQRDHRQRATDLRQQAKQRLQVLAVVAVGQKISDQVFDLFKANARLFDHQLMNLNQVRGGQAAFFSRRRLDIADHPGQRGFDVQQGGSHIHQHGVCRLALPLGDALDHRQLVDDDFSRLAKTEHCQGVGDLAQRRHQAAQLGHV